MSVNLIPWRDKKMARDSLCFFLIIFVGILLAFAVAFLFRLYLNKSSSVLTKNNRELIKKISAIAVPNNLKFINENYQSLLSKIKTINLNYIRINKISCAITLIAESLPDNSWLTTIQYQDNVFHLNGSSLTLAAINQFAKRLQQKPFIAVKFNKIYNADENASAYNRFQIEARIASG